MTHDQNPSPIAGEVSAKPTDGGGSSNSIGESIGATPTTDPTGLSGSVENGTHRLLVRVYYEDTDFSGVVYHASYLRFMERGRTDFLRLAGVDQSTLHAEGAGLIFAVRRMTIDFHRPARMDDVLLIETRTADIRGASLVMAQRILRGEELIVSAEVRVAALSGGRPARIPDGLRAIFSGEISSS
jgi:acyl-CoA thioester hydrolase